MEEPRLLAIRAVVEAYVSSVAPDVPTLGFLSLIPWSSRDKPANVLAPEWSCNRTSCCGELSSDSVSQMVNQYEAVLIPSVYKTKKETVGVTRLLGYLRKALPDASILLVQLPDRFGAELTRGYLGALMARQEALHALGASGVLTELEADSEGLRQKVLLELQENAALRLRTRRYQHDLEGGMIEGITSSRECQIIEEKHGSLLWKTLPTLLMPGFAPLDDKLLELRNQVSEFRLVRRCANRRHVLLAVNERRETCVVKAREKRKVTEAEQVDRIYQEFRLLAHDLDHPHIIRCLSMLHSRCRVYLVLQYGGDMCMEQVLSTQPGYRLPRDDALDCTGQVASALSYCHARDVVHGQVSLQHVVVETASSQHVCRLVDFSMAAYVPVSCTRETLCGCLPCIAPEVALQGAYLPVPADCWSLGVLLLEAACGLGSLELSVRWRSGVPLAEPAAQILDFFTGAGCHAEAMAKMSGTRDGTALACLEALLKPDALGRASASGVVQLLAAWSSP